MTAVDDTARDSSALRLGAFRVSIALVTMFALADLFPHFREFLSDDGFMPRSSFLDNSARVHRFSLLDAFGRPYQVLVYLGATYAALAALLVGFRTRWASVASFLLVAGIYERNYFVFDGSDAVIRTVLFWLMFNDAGAALSVDARRRGTGDARAKVSALRVGLIEAQIAWVYLGTGILKLASKLWRDGTALHNALANPHVFTRPWAAHFADDVPFVRLGTYATLVFELAFPVLVLALRRHPAARLLAIASGIAFHLGSWSMLNVGGFPLVMIATYAIFAEPAWLAAPERWLDAHVLTPLARRLGPLEATVASPGPAGRRRALDGALIVVFALAVWTSLPSDELAGMPTMPTELRAIPQTLSVWQHWDMFAPAPIRADYVLRARGTTRDGRTVDPLADAPGGAIAVHDPALLYERWTKAIHSIAFGKRAVLLPFARYVCRRWNRGARTDHTLTTYRLYRIERHIAQLGRPTERWGTVEIWNHHCFASPR